MIVNLSLVISLFISLKWIDVIDILLVSILLYQLYNLVKGTAAINIFIGILFIYVLWLIVKALEMELFGTILSKFIDVGFIVLIIVFQQEIRKFLVFLGTTEIFSKKNWLKNIFNLKWQIQEEDIDASAIARAVQNMSDTKTGALIIVTKSSELKFYINTGELMEARVSSKLIESIFYKNSPLHDGAVIITGNTIKAARCVLPVTENADFPSNLGMRHRAAVGISENADAIAIIVSEQTGEVSIARDGKLENDISFQKLKEILTTSVNNR